MLVTAMPMIDRIEINEQFAKALALMEEGDRHIFVTGKAGTGKSTLLEYFRATTDRGIVVLAPTGVAAVNVGGQTIHSFFGFKPDVTIEKAQRAAKRVVKTGRAKIYRKIETLVIDEISMVRADLFDCVDAFMRIARDNKKNPFGGARLAMIGDLYQLPPVVTFSERGIFEGHYASPFFFDAHAYEGMSVEIVELEKIYRQRDDRFVKILNAIRNNTASYEDIAVLNERFDPNAEVGEGHQIHLTSLNREAERINVEKLAATRGRARRFDADISGEFNKKSYPAAATLNLKVGAQVMLLNNDSSGRWINGTIAEVVGMGEELVTVKLSDGSLEDVEPHTWDMFRFELDGDGRSIVSRSAGKFTQLPLMLAWAVTIHKSQGKTFDSALIDVGRAFAPGQVYVALSRLRTLDGIVLKSKLKKGHVRVDYRVMNFLTNHHYELSEKLMPLDEKIGMIEEAIECGFPLKITYLKASDVRSTRVIQPLEVGEMEYSGYQFIGVLALCQMRGEERVFRVDRILTLASVSE